MRDTAGGGGLSAVGPGGGARPRSPGRQPVAREAPVRFKVSVQWSDSHPGADLIVEVFHLSGDQAECYVGSADRHPNLVKVAHRIMDETFPRLPL